ncbi:hypothetical protein KA005_54005 [bacterium]|nr:hypothetical protein [bacterium]
MDKKSVMVTLTPELKEALVNQCKEEGISQQVFLRRCFVNELSRLETLPEEIKNNLLWNITSGSAQTTESIIRWIGEVLKSRPMVRQKLGEIMADTVATELRRILSPEAE